MGNIVNKYQRYCGTCSFWDGNVVPNDSVKVEINTTNAKCSKKNQYYNYQVNFGCPNWQQKIK